MQQALHQAQNNLLPHLIQVLQQSITLKENIQMTYTSVMHAANIK